MASAANSALRRTSAAFEGARVWRSRRILSSSPVRTAARVMTELVVIECHAEARAHRQVDAEFLEAQRLLDQGIGQDLWPEMLATPSP
jgi:hypothetical protein